MNVHDITPWLRTKMDLKHYIFMTQTLCLLLQLSMGIARLFSSKSSLLLSRYLFYGLKSWIEMMLIQRQRIFSAHKWLYKICETKVNVCLNNDSTIIIILLIFAWILKSFFLQLALCLWKDSEEFTIADLTCCWPHSRFLQTDLTLCLKELHMDHFSLVVHFPLRSSTLF